MLKHVHKWVEIDCLLFDAVSNVISVLSRHPVQLSMLSGSSVLKYSAENYFLATGCFPSYPLSEQLTAVREE